MTAPPLRPTNLSVPVDTGDRGMMRLPRTGMGGGRAPRIMANFLRGDNNVSTTRLVQAPMVLSSHSFAFYVRLPRYLRRNTRRDGHWT